MMDGHEKSDLAIVAGKPTNKAERSAAELVERRAGTKGNADQRSTRWTQSRISVSQGVGSHTARFAVDTRGGSRMRESRTYGSVRGARGNSRPYREVEGARQSWRDQPVQVRSSVRLVASVAWPLATVVAKRTQRLHGVWD